MFKTGILVLTVVAVLFAALTVIQKDKTPSDFSDRTAFRKPPTVIRNHVRTAVPTTAVIADRSLATRKTTYAGSQAADTMTSGDPLTLRMDYLLTSRKLTDFSASDMSNISAICQNKRHTASVTACTVFRHWRDLIIAEENLNGPSASIWHDAEKNAGIEWTETSELTPLTAAQMTRESGGESDNLDSMLQSLEDRALFDPSPEIRNNAIRTIVAMKNPAFIPLLKNALNDENSTNIDLAAQGLHELHEALDASSNTNNTGPEQNIAPNSPHLSRADLALR